MAVILILGGLLGFGTTEQTYPPFAEPQSAAPKTFCDSHVATHTASYDALVAITYDAPLYQAGGFPGTAISTVLVSAPATRSTLVATIEQLLATEREAAATLPEPVGDIADESGGGVALYAGLGADLEKLLSERVACENNTESLENAAPQIDRLQLYTCQRVKNDADHSCQQTANASLAADISGPHGFAIKYAPDFMVSFEVAPKFGLLWVVNSTARDVQHKHVADIWRSQQPYNEIDCRDHFEVVCFYKNKVAELAQQGTFAGNIRVNAANPAHAANLASPGSDIKKDNDEAKFKNR